MIEKGGDLIHISHFDIRSHSASVVPPEGANLVLAPDVPHDEGDRLVLDGLDVETDGWDGVNALAKLEPVKDRGLASRVEPNHQDPLLDGAHLFL